MLSRLFAVFLLGAAGARAQAPPKFVPLDIAALGPHGEAVPDLRAGEIELLDNKKPQSIAYWHANNLRTKVPSAMLVVLDLQSTPIKSAGWNEAVQAMRRLEASEYVYLYAVTNGGVLLPVHPLPEAGGDSALVNSPWMDPVLPQFESAARLYQPRHAGVSDYSQYAELAARLADFSGRKSLVCAGCLLIPEKLDPNLQAPVADGDVLVNRAVQVFLEARVAVYVVDGLKRSRYPAGMLEAGESLVFANHVGGFAEVTGGRTYTQGEIGQAIAQAANDGRSSYRLAYLPGTENWDGKRHPLKIVCRRAGVRILAPAWYRADRWEDMVRERPAPIPDSLIKNPFDEPDISISVAPPQKKADGMRITVRVNAADLLLFPQGGRYTGRLDLQALCYMADGRKQACTEPVRVDLDLSEAEHETAIRGGLQFPIDLTADKAGSKIRVVVHDANSGASGSHTFSIGAVQ